MVSAAAKLRVIGAPLERAAGGWRTRLADHPALALVPLLALLLLVGILFPDRQDDESGYLELARNLTHGHFVTHRPDALLDADPSYPDLWFGPGLPLAIAPLVALGLPLAVVRLTGPLFLFAAVTVFYALLRRTLEPKPALVATWALALYLPFYTVLPNLHSEPLAILFLVGALYAISRITAGGSARWIGLGALALAGLALTRVEYGWVVTAAGAGFVLWWAATRARAAGLLAATSVLALILCVPWLAYTYSQTHRPVVWGNSGSLSLYWMSSPYPGDLGDWQQASAVSTDPALAPHRAFFATLAGLDLPAQNRKLERQALENIRRHPARYAENVAANVSRMLFDTPFSRTPQRLSSLYFALPNAILLVALGFAAAVALRARAAPSAAAGAFLILAATSFVLHALVAAYPRMLLPIVPVIVWFVAVTLARHVRVVRSAPQASG